MSAPSPVATSMLATSMLATSMLATLAACSPGGKPDTPSPLARAVGALRAATVGDRRFSRGVPDSGRIARRTTPDSARASGAGRRPVVEQGSTLDSIGTVPFDTSEFPTVVIPFTTTTAEQRTVWAGDTATLPVPEPPAGTPGAIRRDLRWTSSEPRVATVSPEGVVAALTPGTSEIIAWRRVGQTVTPLAVLGAVRGRVVAADGVPLQARVIVATSSWVDTVRIDSAGGFTLRPTRPLGPSVSVRVEPVGSVGSPAGASTHAPAFLAGRPVTSLANLDVVLLPRRWRLTVGAYAGQQVSIEPAIAQGRARDGLRFWRVSRPAREGVAEAGRAVGWTAGQLPLAVAFDTGRGGLAIGPADSAVFWRVARQLERDWGTPLFTPATRLAGAAERFVGIVVAVDARQRTAGLTTVGWNGEGDVTDATVAFQSRALLADPRVATHELLHALGIGHASGGWSSVMHPTADQASGERASIDDIAYGQLLYAVRSRMRPGGTPVGIAEAAAARP